MHLGMEILFGCRSTTALYCSAAEFFGSNHLFLIIYGEFSHFYPFDMNLSGFDVVFIANRNQQEVMSF